jgi:hypothetical protein
METQNYIQVSLAMFKRLSVIFLLSLLLLSYGASSLHVVRGLDKVLTALPQEALAFWWSVFQVLLNNILPHLYLGGSARKNC